MRQGEAAPCGAALRVDKRPQQCRSVPPLPAVTPQAHCEPAPILDAGVGAVHGGADDDLNENEGPQNPTTYRMWTP